MQDNTLVYGIADGQNLAYPVNVSVNAVAAYGIGHYFTYYSSPYNVADDSGQDPDTKEWYVGKKYL